MGERTGSRRVSGVVWLEKEGDGTVLEVWDVNEKDDVSRVRGENIKKL